MKKETAIDWFFKELVNMGFIEHEDDLLVQERYSQAKEKEKELIALAWEDGNYNYFHSKNNGVDFEHGLEYYREKYQGN